MSDVDDSPCQICGSKVRLVTKPDPRLNVDEPFAVRVCTNTACATNSSSRLLHEVP